MEADDAAGMTASLLARGVVTLPSVGLFADGAAVKTVSMHILFICRVSYYIHYTIHILYAIHILLKYIHTVYYTHISL